METIQTQTTSTEELTSYNVDGLELFFTSNRKVKASYRAIARMCETSPSNISLILNKGGQLFTVTHTKILTAGGLQGAHLYDSEAIVACMTKYNPSRLIQFIAFGIDEGLAQMAGVPPIAPAAPLVPPTRLELALMLVDAETRADKAEKQIEADSDFTNLGKLIDNTFGCVTIGEFAKAIGVGRNTYFQELRKSKILMKNSVLPYQNMMDVGYFVVTEKIGSNNIAYPITLVTAKGQTYLAKRHKQYLAKEIVTVQMERELSLI